MELILKNINSFMTTTKSSDTDEKILEPETKFLVSTIGELREHKGQEDFIKAASLVAQKVPNVKFLIIGQDNSKEQKYHLFLARLVKELNLEDSVIFTGWQENITKFYSMIDVFVSSARSEPFGLVIAEAMASGKAIVATETVGGKELLINNQTGKLVPIGNVEAIASATCDFLADEYLRRDLGKQARIVAKAKFSLERMVIETENVYQMVVAQKEISTNNLMFTPLIVSVYKKFCVLFSRVFLHSFASKSYSYLKASIGFNRAAFHAGNNPKINPSPTDTTNPTIGAHNGM